MNLIYLGTPGVGENIQMIPAWREWRTNSVTRAVRNLDVVLPLTQAQSDIFDSTNWIVRGYDIRWARDGSVILDQSFINWLHIAIGAEPCEIRSRQHIDVEGTLPKDWNVEPRFPSPGGISVPEGNGLMINGKMPSSTAFFLNLKALPESTDICLCSGSNENMRSIPPSSFVHLAQKLAHQLHGGASLPKKKRLALVLANDRYLGALDTMWPNWKDQVFRWCVDEGTAITLQGAGAVINNSLVTISPDTGTAHIALAAAMGNPARKFLFLPTREFSGSVFSAEQLSYMTRWVKSAPACDKGCRSYHPGAHVPKDYPWSLKCSRSSSVPCLMFSESDIKDIANIATMMLAHAKSATTPPMSYPLPVPEEAS